MNLQRHESKDKANESATLLVPMPKTRPVHPSPVVSEEQDRLLVVMVLRAAASLILLVPFVPPTPNLKSESFTFGRMVSALTMEIFDGSMTPQTRPIWH